MVKPSMFLRPLFVSALALSAGAAHAQSNVGTAAAVNPLSSFERGGGAQTITIGADVQFEDQVVTSDEGLVQVLFVDGSAFTVGPNARVLIDEFVYDPSDQSGELVAEVAQGALRFVGGALSKRGRGRSVKFRTKGGTLGVRGGIVNIDTNPPCDRAPCPTVVASLVFGDELILERDGLPDRRIYDAGYSFVVRGDGGSAGISIAPTQQLDQSALQDQLTGQPGTSGGATTAPTEEAVIASELPEINSLRAPVTVLPRPRPIVVRTQFTPEDEQPGVAEVTNQLDDTLVEAAQSDFIDNDVEAEIDPPVEPDPVVRETFVQATSTPSRLPFDVIFNREDPRINFDPGDVGITTPTGVPLVASLIEDGSGNVVALDVNGVVLPFPELLGETQFGPIPSNGIANVPVSGTVLRGPDNFVFYSFQFADAEPGDVRDIAYVVSGELTPLEQVLPATPIGEATIREYSLSDDFQRKGNGVSSALPQLNPLVAVAFGDALDGAAETKFFVAERGGERSFAQTFYAGLLIDGQGAEQKSAITVDTGRVVSLSGQPGQVGKVNGSFRLDARDGSVIVTGPTGTLLPQEGTGGFYGANANNFVYTTGRASTAALNQPSAALSLVFDDADGRSIFTASPDRFSQFTVVGSLEAQTPVGERDRRSAVFEGVAAGMSVSSQSGAVPFRSTSVGDMVIAFDPANSEVGGFIAIDDTTDADSIITRYRFAFGTNLEDPDARTRGRSAYVDNDNFAATSAFASNPTREAEGSALLDSGEVTITRPNGAYLVSSDAVPQSQFFADAGVTPCECEFLEWGWWGSELSTFSEGVAARTHLGTWAAGEVTAASDLPTTGTGVYQGHAIGSVVNSTSGTTQEYVAAGNARVDFNFSARTGNVAISDFDGRSFGGAVAQVPATGGGNQFAGALNGSGLSGQTVGAFVNGPAGAAQGVIGNFNVGGEDYSATGVYVGER